MTRLLISLPLVLLAVFTLTACEQAKLPTKQIEELSELAKNLKESVATLPSKGEKGATEEIEKYFAFEYKVLELEKTEATDIETELAAIGKERWDCFHVEKESKKLRFFCKRRPKSYLRYLSHLL